MHRSTWSSDSAGPLLERWDLWTVGLGLAVVPAKVCVEVPVAALLVPANSPHLLDTIPDHDITTLRTVVGRADRHVSASGDLEVELSTKIIGKFTINILTEFRTLNTSVS